MTPHYSPIAHLAYALFLNYDPRHTYMAMFTGYFDASGSPDDTVALTVAGYVSTVEKWLKFEKEWNAILKDEGITFLHMKEYVHSVGQFLEWKGDEKRRAKFLAALVKVLKKRVHKSFGGTVILKDFYEVDRIYTLHEEDGPPYSLCGEVVVGSIRRWMKKTHPQDRIEYVFENGDKHKGQFIARMDRDGIIVQFKNKNECVPFQAADLLAWENRYFRTQLAENKFEAIRHSLAELAKIPSEWGEFNTEALLRMCDANPDYYKRRD